MKVLVLGGGAREHALVWKLAGERSVAEVVCAPGNAGISRLARCLTADLADPAQILDLAERERVDLTVVGPEQPLAAGVVDLVAATGRLVLGPTRQAAEIEWSKAFAKDLMGRHGIPTARCRVCESPAEALAVVGSGELGYPVVLKADGLAAGKGVRIAPDRASAEAAVRELMVERRLGDAGARLVIEEELHGREVSFFALTDGIRAVPLAAAEDHKRALDGDRGPNTGGMGAFAPSPLVDASLAARIVREIVRPTLDGLRAEGREFRGFLYAGLMLTAEGPKVVEFNARLGDPEAQVVVPMLDEDLLPLLIEAASGSLQRAACRLRSEPHVGVVMASGGYPGTYEVGKPIAGLEDVEVELDPDVLVFHAGTRRHGPGLVTAGGRVLTVVGRGSDFAAAISHAYDAVARISFAGMQYRKDIGAKAFVRLTN